VNTSGVLIYFCIELESSGEELHAGRGHGTDEEVEQQAEHLARPNMLTDNMTLQMMQVVPKMAVLGYLELLLAVGHVTNVSKLQTGHRAN